MRAARHSPLVAGAALAVLLGACAYGTLPNDPDPGGTDQNQTESPAPDAATTPDPTPSTPPPPPPVDAGIKSLADAGGAEAAVDAGPVTCTKTMTITKVNLSNKVCTDINTQVTKGAATLTYPCAGGVATATFGNQTFTGTVTAGKVLITNVMQFDLGSCHLESTQTVTGDVATPPFGWSYGERFVSGNCSSDIICTANANVSVQ
jgi:hypothetical protein